MIPVLSAEQLKAADAFTIEHEPISSLDLMERAAGACTAEILQRHPVGSGHRFVALCGTGNNGGDGLAIARLLHEAGRAARIVLCRHRPELSADAQANLERARNTGLSILELDLGSALPAIAEDEVVLDALFGTGLDRPLDGWLKDLIGELDRRDAQVISIDMPSGLFAGNNASNDPQAIVRAELVLTIGTPKLSLLLPENAIWVGQWASVPIGLDRNFMHRLGSDLGLMELSDVARLLPPRERFAHKGTFGHALLICGRSGSMGAAILAARACARSGVGLITAHVPADHQATMYVAIPEALVSIDPSGSLVGGLPKLDAYGAIGVGPGLGQAKETAGMLYQLLQEATRPLVIDADALNLLAQNPGWLAFLPKASILTPHPREFDRMTEEHATGFDRLQRAREFATRQGVIIVLKGAHTAICSPEGQVFFNPNGNPGMARGGSGDVLTGLITGLLAQGIQPLQAAMLGAFAHGLAGDLAAGTMGVDGMLPSDLIAQLPTAWKRIREAA